MLFSSYLRSLISNLNKSGKRRRGHHGLKTAWTIRPFLELLEGRLCPSADLVVSATTGIFPQFKPTGFNFAKPSSATKFYGAQVLHLSTGNIVVTDPGGAGAVYLFNGQSGALISALTGTGDPPLVTALTNGNFVVASRDQADDGAVTWVSGTTGISGIVSAANSIVGVEQGGGSGDTTVTALTNGNYVVANWSWHGGYGWVMWADGTKPLTGTASTAAYLTGSSSTDTDDGALNVVALPGGNYVVVSPRWNGLTGAVTWGDGTKGVSGIISATNSLVGANAYDLVGDDGITVLANGNYVVRSGGAGGIQGGCVTWCDASKAVIGPVSASNSLVGSRSGDNVGIYGSFGLTALTNGNYVIASPDWDGSTGAVTWCDGTKGISGTVSAANSLVGASPGDRVGGGITGNILRGVTALTNGNYVVSSPAWNSEEGAATWCNGATGTVGVVSAANSITGDIPIVGNTSGDLVGLAGITALANGNYVVDSYAWNSNEGAATWGNGTTGTTGSVSATNSLVGRDPSTDQVGSGGVTVLANGNYVVDSFTWNFKEGAATWGNGTTGTTGSVSATNSLVGRDPSTDQVGSGGVIALANGNYVVDSPTWHSNEGAATWGNGTTGATGAVSATNSLVGNDSSSDEVSSFKTTALANGNYVVLSPNWQSGLGAATWGNGTTGTEGTVTGANSLIDFPNLDTSNGVFAVTPLPNGNYVVINAPGTNDTGGIAQPQATWVDGESGETLDGQNTPNAQNSIQGGGGGVGIQPISSGDSFIVSIASLPPTFTLAFSDPNLLTYALGDGQSITVTPGFLTRSLDAGANITLQASDDIIIDSPITENATGAAGSLTLQAGRSILLNAGINTAGGNLTLIANDTLADGVVDSDRDPGNATITEQSGVTINTGAGALAVDLEHSTDKTNNGSGVVTLLSVTGSVTLSSGTTVGFSINGSTPGDGLVAGSYTQANVTGSINLDGALLSVTHTAATTTGTSFTILQTTAGVSGEFNGLSEGAAVVAQDGTAFTISYQGNGGKNVVLTQNAATTHPGQLQFTAASYSATEGGPNATITVTRTNGSSGNVTVAYATGGGTAVAGQDYTSASGTLTFGDGVTNQTFTVPILNNGQTGGSETVNVNLSGATLGNPASAVLTIQNAGTQPGQLAFSAASYSATEGGPDATITVTRTNGSSGSVTVAYATGGGTAVAGQDYTPASGTLTFGAGVTSQTFTVPILNNGQTGGSETVNVTLSGTTGGATLGNPASAVLTIQNAGTQPGQLAFSAASYSATEGGPNATITVTRTNGSSGSVTVAFATGGGTAVAGQDYTSASGTLTFGAGVTSQTFSVPILNNGQTGGSETVNVTLSGTTGGATLASPSSAVLTLQNSDSNPLSSQFHFSVGSSSVPRTAGSAVITVVRTGGTSASESVQYATSDGTAKAGTDYTATSGTLTFAPGATAEMVSISVLNDGQNNGDESLTLSLTNPTGGALLDSPNALTLTINDPFPLQPIPSNLTAVASIFTHSAEAFGRFVTGAYSLYLKRQPDSQGLAYWIDQLQHQGLTDEKLETGLLSSTEYIASHGGTGSAWVIGMYQDLLGRNPDPGGLTYWTNVLANGGSAYSVALGFAASAEREGERIAGDYQIYLGRQLDAAGQAYWVNQFLNGARNEDVVAGFVGSLEYYQNPGKGQSNHATWIDSAFQDVLQRDPSSDDLAHWLTQLN